MIDLPIMRNHQSPPPSPPPDSILKRDALVGSGSKRVCKSCAVSARAHIEEMPRNRGDLEPAPAMQTMH